ncbi:MAG: hypothetical protein Q8N63_04795 [Nanoarchaeota archaeon]|nr:hypothetical protein [Nanoarchaeota archaeon]
MGLLELFSETPEVITNTGSTLSGAASTLIVIMLLIGILYWIRTLQKGSHTEIRVYRRP